MLINRSLIDRAGVVVKSPEQKEFCVHAVTETNQSHTPYSSPPVVRGFGPRRCWYNFRAIRDCFENLTNNTLDRRQRKFHFGNCIPPSTPSSTLLPSPPSLYDLGILDFIHGPRILLPPFPTTVDLYYHHAQLYVPFQ